ncbi:MAG: glutamate--tRNA ligase [Betaproteobacteria bacterium]|nr:glutamate--tRNA ligase [Betaproteobacteria bacterium]
MIRTRFAPSPTGYLHIGGARTALYSWAYARRQGGKFFLRIEDTDLERSTEASVQAILDSMAWLALDSDRDFHSADGMPMRQMQRLARYREVADQLIRAGRAYPCYASREELDAMREAQRARGEKPRYDGRWRPEHARGKAPPAGVEPVIRFRNPDDGMVGWADLVKGSIEIANAELDDLVILRADGVPTYNFGVVVDDLDMQITHVIRGDDHVNNTPRQINIYEALGAPLPSFAHVPMILGADGERLSKRHGAVSVTQYREEGYLADALVNFLARLGWSHGDDEIFSREQFVGWFDLAHVSRSAAQFNPEKLAWLNGQYIKAAAPETLVPEVAAHVEANGGTIAGGPPLANVVALLKDRALTLAELADNAMLFYGDIHPSDELLAQHLTADSRPALTELAGVFAALEEWREEAIAAAFDSVLKKHQLKMPKLAMPVRAVVFGQTQTPSLYPVLALAGRERVVGRLQRYAA